MNTAKFFRNGFVRFIIGFIVFLLVGVILQEIVTTLAEDNPDIGVLLSLLFIPGLFLIYGLYYLYIKLFEQRKVSEFDREGALKELGLGILLGFLMFSTVLLLVWIVGSYTIIEFTPNSQIIISLLFFALGAYWEEIVFRGIFFRITEDWAGTWAAIILSASFFGLTHALSPGATLVSSISIALTAGILFCVIYAYTDRLWTVIGIHFMWNFTQGVIFGMPVSGGEEHHTLVESELSGNTLLSGGEFGVEASIFTSILLIPLSIYFIWKLKQKERIKKGFWQKRKITDNYSHA